MLAAAVGPALAGRIGGPPESIPPSDPGTDDRVARAAMPFICFGCFVFLALGVAGIIGLVVWKRQKK